MSTNNNQDQGSNTSAARQEELGSKVNGRSHIREGRSRKGGVNQGPKTPRPDARPQPQGAGQPSGQSSSEGSE
jgi:hypothetical protein